VSIANVVSGPACSAPSAATPASTVTFNAITGTATPAGYNVCQFVDVFATGGVVPVVSATITGAPWASFNYQSGVQTLALGTVGTTGAIGPYGSPANQPPPQSNAGFPICVNQSLVPLGSGTVTGTITVQGTGVGTITIPISFITSPAGPSKANFKQIGIFRGNGSPNAYFALDSNGSNNYEASDKVRAFGLPGDVPVAGDFFGTGTIEIGVFRCPAGASTCQWYIDANNNGAWDGQFGGDQIWNFGLPGDIPVVGDWNGNGTSKIGIFRCPATGTCLWVLDAGNKHAYDPTTSVSANFGLAGDIPVVNNWNGTGTVDQVGIFRGNGLWIVDSNGSGQWEASDMSFSYGLTGDKPVVGNWNGTTGIKRVGVFRPSGGYWVFNLSGSDSWSPLDATGSFGLPGDQPIVGLWTLP
jgi:hypothetical protein